MPKSLRYIKKQYLCTALEQCTGLWCNGNTADSGPAFPGSSPGSPAHKRRDADAPLLCFCELGYPDSNQERQDQNLQCYHYTIAQYIAQKRCKDTAFF